MAADIDPIEENPGLKRSLKEGGIPVDGEAAESGPIYRVFKDAKIPVAKHTGKIWESRIDQAGSQRKDAECNWSEAIRYYEHDQSQNRAETENRSTSRGSKRLGSETWSATENVVFSNAATMLPMLYAKNPQVEVTPTNEEVNSEFARAAEHLVNTLFTKKEAPGINIKSKARRAVLGAYLANTWYLKIDWIKKEDSSEEAIKTLTKLSEELRLAKSAKAIKEVEGKIRALENKIDILSPSGPSIKICSPFRIYVDPASQEPDHSDANWMAEFDYIQTDLLNAVYGKPTEDGETVSVYEPTHVLSAQKSNSSVQDEVNNFSLFKTDQEVNAAAYGYKDERAYKKAQYTKVWYVWDKTTRRLLMFADNKWEWPLWVWDDPLKLPRFFPYYRLWFHETPDGSQPKGEVTYYLDQQDTINDINSEISRARKWIRNNVFFDKNAISQEDVESVLKGPDGTARGIDIPEGKTLKDVLFSAAPPSISYPELLSTQSSFEAINKISGVSAAQQGAQFRTNTTNKAVDFYQNNIDIRVDDRIDAIEDWLGEIGFGILCLCCQYMSIEEVAGLIGQEKAKGWKQVTSTTEFSSMLSVQVIGGSTQKPTSKAKKEQAVQMGQIIGQFAAAAPAAVIVMLKTFEKAFDDFSISEDDWRFIRESIEAQMQNQGGTGGAAQENSGQASPEEAAQIEQVIASLPPEGKAALQQMIEGGVPPSQALQQVQEQYSQTQSIQ
jgi:hypothetical protein